MVDRGLDLLARADVGWHIGIAHHLWDGRAEHVGVEQAHPGPLLLQGRGQIGGHRGLAHAALARRDRDDVAHPGQPLALGAGSPCHLGGENDFDAGDAGQSSHCLADRRCDRVARGAGGRGQLEVEANLAALHAHLA